MNQERLTIVVPSYNEEESLEIFVNETDKCTENLPLEIEYLFIDDGSTDKTLYILKELSNNHKNIKYLSFSRNFGKEAAIYAGLENAKGDYIVIMDADLQDPPALLPEMYRLIKHDGYDCVGSRRVNRKGEPPIRSFFARMFYKIMNHFSKTEIVDGARDFQMLTGKVRDSILKMTEKNRFSKGIFGWVGFRKKWLEYENIERAAGETKWSFWKLFVYALDGMLAFSTIPLVFSSLIGIVFCIIALIMIVFIIVRTLVYGDPTGGWPSLVCIIMMVSGVQLFCIGILGAYLAKAYIETKNRPIYLIQETNLNDQ